MEQDKLQQAKDWIATARSITVLTGAGVSAESGISTYRDADGLWNNFKAEDFSSATAFQEDPAKVWGWYHDRRRIMGKTKPNAAHEALATLEKKTDQFMLLTQNIDGLHQRAGTDNIVELHGSAWKLRCVKCLGEWEDKRELTGIPYCDSCKMLARPAVVWFGESLVPAVWDRAVRATYCDVFLVTGTSAMVDPVASLPYMAQLNRARVIEVNKEETPLSKTADISLIGNAGEILPELTKAEMSIGGIQELDLGRAMQRGLEKFYMKFPQLRPNAETKLPEDM